MDAWAHKVGHMFPVLFFSVYQPLRSQYSPIFLSLDSTCITSCPPSAPTSHSFVSTHNTTSNHAIAQIFYLIWQETLKAATSSKGCLKGNKLMHTVCKFHMHAYFPQQTKMFISKLIMCDLDQFSEIQSHI